MHDEATKAVTADGGSSGSAQGVLPETPLVTTYLRTDHNVTGFLCEKSERVRGFLLGEAQSLIRRNYARVFVAEDHDDPRLIRGYYSLSAALIDRKQAANKHTRNNAAAVPMGLPVPLVRVGYMGRDDRFAGQKLGPMLLRDAALRVIQNPTIAAWGLMLNPENDKLAEWYKKIGFDTCKKIEGDHTVMYAPLSAFLTDDELNLCPAPICEYVAE